MPCPTCDAEGDNVDVWVDDDGNTWHTYYCETCSECYFEKILVGDKQ